MQRTAEVHQLPTGRWFVGDFARTDSDGAAIFLVETSGEPGAAATLASRAR